MSSFHPWMTKLAEAVSNGLAALVKDAPMTAVEWADKYFYMSSESSYQEGQWTTEPFQVAMLNAMGNDQIRVVNIRKSARVGFTKMLHANKGYKLHHKRRNVLAYCPTDPDAEANMKEHVEPMLRDVEELAELAPWIGKKHRDSSLTRKRLTNRKTYWCLGGKAARNYRGKSADEVIYDELSKFDASVEKEGSPTFLGDKRLEGATFPKSIRGSTPGIDGECQITKAAEESPLLLRYHLPCPHCRREQTLKWGGPKSPFGIKFERNQLGEAARAWYVCEHTACVIEYHEAVEAARAGRWICERTGIWTRDGMDWFDQAGELIDTPPVVSFYIWSAYSTFATWLKIVEDFLKVKNDRETLIAFVNTTLGETWQEDQGERVEWEQLHGRREVYPTVPRRAVALTAGIDTQDDRYEGRVWAWGADEECWLVDRWVLTGDPGSEALRKQVRARLRKVYTRADGVRLPILRGCWDSGGHYTDEVYAESKALGVHWIIPVRGSPTYGRPIATWPKKRNKQRVYLVEVGTDNAKETIYARLKIQPSTDGKAVEQCIHLPANDAICDEEELQQLTAETKVLKVVQGERVFRWEAKGRRNEALDCFVYALAALRLSQARFGLDLDELAKALPPEPDADDDTPADPVDDPDQPDTPPPPPPPPPPPVVPAAPAAAGGWLQIEPGGSWLR